MPRAGSNRGGLENVADAVLEREVEGRDAQLDELVAHGDELIPRGGNLNVVLLEDVDVVEDRHIVAGVRHGIVLAVVGRRHGQVALVDLIEEGLIRKLLIVAVLDLLLELHLGRPVGENRRAVVRRDAGGEHLRRVRHRVLGDLDVRIFLLEVGDDGLVAGLDRFLALLLEELELDDVAARVAVAAGVRGVGRSRFRGVAAAEEVDVPESQLVARAATRRRSEALQDSLFHDLSLLFA